MLIINYDACNSYFCLCWVITLPILILLVIGNGTRFLGSNDLTTSFYLIMSLFVSLVQRHFQEMLVIICSSFKLVFTLLLEAWSYSCLIQTVLQFPSTKQSKKAFSTLSSHMIVGSLNYGSLIISYIIYINPTEKDEMNIDKGDTLLANFISPMITP